MDRFSILGIAIGIGALLVTQVADGGHLASLVQLPAAFIVGLGTLGATCLSCSATELKSSQRELRSVFVTPPDRSPGLPGLFRDLAFLARKDGLLALDKPPVVARTRATSAFLSRSLRHVIDGCEQEQLREILESDSRVRHQRALAGAQVFEVAGGYAPTMGILGAVLGLIRAMESLAEPEALGAGIAVAFVATIYGVGAANLLLLPLAAKIRQRVRTACAEDEIVIEGTLGLQAGLSPRMLERQLAAHLAAGSDS